MDKLEVFDVTPYLTLLKWPIHVLSRIFRQPQGHLLLIGVSGAGKTTLSRFVAWMNGLSVYQIKVSKEKSSGNG